MHEGKLQRYQQNGTSPKVRKNSYEHYDDQFNNYRKKNKSALQQWSLMESQLMSKKDQSPENGNQHLYSYCMKINQLSKGGSYDNKSISDISNQLNQMRELMKQCNEELNGKLGKYELVEFQPKTLMVENSAEKQSELLLAQIQTNNRAMELQEKQIDKLRKKDKDLEERDYLIQLEERMNKISKSIHQKKKQKHEEGVVVHKLDNRLIELNQNGDEFKNIKILKHQILFYFKRFHENRQRMEELDQRLEEMVEKDSTLNQKYRYFVKQAEEKFLLVSANRSFLLLKNKTDQMIKKIQSEKRKNEVQIRSQSIKQEKLEKEMWLMEKQINQISFQIEENSQKNETLSKQTDLIIEKHQIPSSKIKNIAYRFRQDLIKDSPLNNAKIREGPFVKLDKKERQKSIDVKKNLHTIEEKYSSPKNDKNYELQQSHFNQQSPQKNQFRINLKPKLSIRNKKGENSQTIDVMQLEKNEEKSGYVEMPSYRPARFKKLLSGKRDNRMNGPLSEEYMKSLEEKGRKNLNI